MSHENEQRPAIDEATPVDELIIVSGFELAATSATDVARQLRDKLLKKARLGKKIDSAQSMQRAAAFLTELKTFTRSIEDRRKEAKAPIIELGKRIEALADELSAEVEAEAERISRMLGTYQQEQKRLEAEEQRKAAQKEQEIIAEANRVAAQKKKKAEEAQAAIDKKAAEDAAAAKKKADDEAAEIQRKAAEDAAAAKKRADEERAELEARKANSPAGQKRLEKERADQARAAQEEQDRIHQKAADDKAAADKAAEDAAEAARTKAAEEKEALAKKSSDESAAHTEQVENQIVTNRVSAAGLMVAKPSGIATGDKLEFEVEDLHELYAANPALVVLTPQKSAIASHLKSLRADQKLPGVKHWWTAKAVVRRA